MDTNFRPLPVADLLSLEPKPVRWVWEPFLPEGGLALLVAFMKVGKTTFAYALAAAVAQGRPFLGFPTKRGGVLLLALEEHPRDVRLRLKRFGIRPARRGARSPSPPWAPGPPLRRLEAHRRQWPPGPRRPPP